MVSPLDQIRNRHRAKVSPRPDPLAHDLSAPVRAVELSEVSDRASDTRPVNDEHVRALIESISAVGLITPLTLDQEGTLLAGAHRLAALRALQAEQPERFERLFPQGKVPARLMPLSASRDALAALRVEIEENEQRLDYSPDEVCAVADQLLAEGYVYARGRPREGDQPLIPALELIFGKSRATIKRYLAQRQTEEREAPPTAPLSASERGAQRLSATLSRLQKQARKGSRELNDLLKATSEGDVALSEAQRAHLLTAQEALERLERSLKEG